MFGRKKRDAPHVKVTKDKVDAINALQEARARRKDAEKLSMEIHDRASELAIVKDANHFYDSFVTILRVE